MTLREFIELHKNDEVEVWDDNVDISCPYYAWGEPCFKDTETDHYLHVLEKWLLGLKVKDCRESTCWVDVYSFVEKNWETLSMFYASEDEDGMCDCTEDVFTTLSQGVYGFAKMFVKAMRLEGNNDKG